MQKIDDRQQEAADVLWRPVPADTALADEAQLAGITDLYAGRVMPGQQAFSLAHTDRSFPVRVVRRGGAVRPLAYAARTLQDFPIIANGMQYDLYDYVSRNRVAGLLILKNGEVVHERYELGMLPGTRWLSMSMAKSISTTLVGAAIQDGAIASVRDPLTRYLPQLAGTAYGDVSVQALLQMTSGVAWDDTHTDPVSQRRRMLELQVAQQPDAILRYVADQPRAAAPGTLWNYSTGETHVVGALLKAATGRWLSDYLSEKIWAPLGMEADATWWLESPGGLEVAGSGISATLRDYARFAAFVRDDGVIDGVPVLPPGWTREAGAAREVGGRRLDYGYMWWSVPARDGGPGDGAFSARGIFGQFLYINPAEQVVIVVLSSRAKPKFAEAIVDNDFFHAVVEALR